MSRNKMQEHNDFMDRVFAYAKAHNIPTYEYGRAKAAMLEEDGAPESYRLAEQVRQDRLDEGWRVCANPECEELFFPTRSNQRYCCKKCSAVVSRMQQTEAHRRKRAEQRGEWKR